MTDHIVDVNKKVPEWDAEGNPMNLLAAAEDAYEWLSWLSRHPLTGEKDKLMSAKQALRKFLNEAQA